MRIRTHRQVVGLTILILTLVTLIVPSAPRSPAHAAGDLKDLVRAYETSLSRSAETQQEAAMALFKRYGEYKALIAQGGQVSQATARALDERLVGMTQDIWREVSVRRPGGLSHIVPVGTLGDRLNNTAYIPGKSDKDFIPRGSQASEAAQDFTEAFERKFGIPASSVDANALDPTDISKWPDRVLAATNFEKYNTKGGIAWLEADMYKKKPDLWRFNAETGQLEQVKFDRLVTTPPPPLNPEDAAGFLSDNMKFRQHLTEEFGGDPLALSLKQAKYDQRNVEALLLAGGELTDAEKKMLECTGLMRDGKMSEAAAKYAGLIGETDPQKALVAYREAIESLTERVTKEVIEKHIALIASGKMTQAATDELAAAVANMPQYKGMVEKAVSEKLGKAEWNEISKLADAFGKRVSVVRYGIEYFNEQALKYFGKPYDKLSDAQRAILHGAEDAAESAGIGKILGTGLNAAFSAYSVYSSYEEGARKGTATGVAHAAGRTFIELLQLGYPPAQIAELIGLAAAGLVNLGAEAYKNDVLNALYDAYRANPSDATLRDLLDTQSILGYYAGGIREFAKSLRMDDQNLTEEQIREKLRAYLAGRLGADQMQAQLSEIENWVKDNDIPLLPGGDWLTAFGDNARLKSKDAVAYNRLLAGLLAAYDDWATRLRADGIPFTDETIKHILWLTYRGKPEDLQKFLNELYANSPTPCKLSVGDGQLGRIISARGTIISQTTPSRGGAIARPQVLVGTGGSFREKPVDTPCDPARRFGPFEIAGSGQISATIDGNPPVPNTWSLYNSNTSMAVSFEPKVGGGYRGGDTILALSGQAENSHLKGGAEWGGAGRLWVTIGAPAGAGPLTGACFEQSYSARVAVVAVKGESPAAADDRLLPGDQLITDGNGETVVQLPDCSKLLVRPNSTLTLTSPKDGVVQVQVTRGGFRLQRPSGGVHGLQVKLGNATARPVGTEFEVQWTGESGEITVLDGAVSLTPDDGGAETRIAAGQRCAWPSGEISSYDVAAEDPTGTAGLVGGLPLGEVLTDDSVPEPFGPKTAEFADNHVPSDWVWQDPGGDTKLETPAPGTLQLTVPNGNDFWNASSAAPRLLHKVTGDFDLEAEVRLDCKGGDMSSLEFLLYSPGSALGDLAKQMRGDDLMANYRLVGGGWLRGAGLNKLLWLNKPWQSGVDAPIDGLVRLRLTRRGDLWKSYWSTDRQTWRLSWREELSAPDTVWVGWVAKRQAYDGLTDEPAHVTLRDVRLVTAARGNLGAEPWDLTSPDGVASVDGEQTLSLSMDGSRLGSTSFQSTEPLSGDFDVVARFQTSNDPARQPGQSRYALLSMNSGDDKQRAFALWLDSDGLKNTLATNLGRDGGWLGEDRQPAYDTTRLRIVRRGDRVSTFRWSDCTWAPLSSYDAAIPEPLYVSVGIGNDRDAGAPGPVKARWTIEQITADDSPLGVDWAPASCSVLTPAELPASVQVPEGLRAQWLAAPFALGSLFFGPDGSACIFSNERGKQELLAADADGTARPFVQSELLAGINGKNGAWADGQVMVAIDFWPDGGNPYGGLFRLSGDGSFSEWKLAEGHGGMADVIAAPNGGWYFADFENDNVWYLAAEGVPEQKLITQGDVPPGVTGLAYDPAAGALYALNVEDAYPFGGQAGVYRITPDGQAELVVAPLGSKNFGGMAVSPGASFAAGLYVSEPQSGEILRVSPDGQTEPAVTGLTNPGTLGFSPTTGALWVVCDGKAVLICSSPMVAPAEKPAVRQNPTPEEQPSKAVVGPTATRATSARAKAGASVAIQAPTATPTPTPTATPTPTPESAPAPGRANAVAGGSFGAEPAATQAPPKVVPTRAPLVEPTRQKSSASAPAVEYELLVKRLDVATEPSGLVAGQPIRFNGLFAANVWPEGGPLFPATQFRWRPGAQFDWQEGSCPANTHYANCSPQLTFVYPQPGKYEVRVELNYRNEIPELDGADDVRAWVLDIGTAP